MEELNFTLNQVNKTFHVNKIIIWTRKRVLVNFHSEWFHSHFEF